jgi:hypothetical protein
MRGGNSVFPASFSNNSIVTSPQSYLPYNNFANDPNYSVIGSRNTGNFLTGVLTGGSRRQRRKIRGGGGLGSSFISNVVNSSVNQVGIMPAPAISEFSGAAGMMSGFSNNSFSYNSTPANISPLA